MTTFEELKQQAFQNAESRIPELHKINIPYKTNEEYNQIINNVELDQKSKDFYLQRMNFVKDLLNENSIHNILIYPLEMGKNIIFKSNDDITSIDNSFKTILAYLKYSNLKNDYHILFTTWYDIIGMIKRQLKYRTDNNIPSEKQKLGVLDWEDIIKKRKSLKYASEDHLLLSIYTFLPPRRQMDYYQTLLYTDPNINPPKDHNFLQLYNNQIQSPQLYIHECKNAKFHDKGFLNTEIPTDFILIIQKSLQKKPRQYLFTTEKNKPYNLRYFTKYTNDRIKKIFNNDNITVTMLRHSFANYINTQKNLTFADKKKISNKMGHDFMRNQQYVLLMDN